MKSILVLSVLLFSASVHGQESRQVSCRFLSFGANHGPAEVIATTKEGAEVTCPLPSGRLTDKIACTAIDNRINFLSSKEKKPAAVTTIPAGTSAAILIFVRTAAPAREDDADAAPEWRVFVIEDNARTFPDGGVFVANISRRDTRFIIGEHKGMLKAGGSNGYGMPKTRDNFNMAPVVFEMQQETGWRKASESGLRFLPGTRYLIIAYQDPVSGRPRIATVKDITPPEAVKKAN